jgi:DNA-directed RNA polymerase specialized sigma24 family protein
MDVMVSARRDLEGLYREHGKRLWWALVAFSGDREIASDAESEAFAQALRRGDVIRDPLAWIWRTAFRIAAGELKARGQQAPRSSEPWYELPEPAAEVTAGAPATAGAAAGRGRPHYYADRPIREMADVLGTSSSTWR